MQSADTASSDPAPPERRTREKFDPAALKRDPLFTTLAACLGYEPLTRREWWQWREAVNQLHAINATAEDIPRAIRGYQANYPNAKVTPLGLIGRWAESREGKAHDIAQLEVARRATAAETAAQRERQRADAERRAREADEVERFLLANGYGPRR